MKHNIGKNISKYFHGSYSLEGNLVPNGKDRRVAHSNYARKIVNQLIIAQLYTPGFAVQSTICTIDRTKTFKLNETTSAIYFKAMKQENSFRRFYPGLSMLGKHFTVKKCHVDKVTR